MNIIDIMINRWVEDNKDSNSKIKKDFKNKVKEGNNDLLPLMKKYNMEFIDAEPDLIRIGILEKYGHVYEGNAVIDVEYIKKFGQQDAIENLACQIKGREIINR
jgi:hypothetical protein